MLIPVGNLRLSNLEAFFLSTASLNLNVWMSGSCLSLFVHPSLIIINGKTSFECAASFLSHSTRMTLYHCVCVYNSWKFQRRIHFFCEHLCRIRNYNLNTCFESPSVFRNQASLIPISFSLPPCVRIYLLQLQKSY